MFGQFGFLDFGTPELLIILAIVLLLFGSKQLPKLTKSVGESIRELRKSVSDEPSESKTEAKNASTKTEESSAKK
ncbi:MAG TPA: twin-arginine translocase TatA/TatE family subunit [Candidatus Saccharimonadales bacterium]